MHVPSSKLKVQSSRKGSNNKGQAPKIPLIQRRRPETTTAWQKRPFVFELGTYLEL
jgi:hypothetical protein